MAIEIVDLAINSMVIFHNLSLPEGKLHHNPRANFWDEFFRVAPSCLCSSIFFKPEPLVGALEHPGRGDPEAETWGKMKVYPSVIKHGNGKTNGYLDGNMI
jgi:hypothetical protein